MHDILYDNWPPVNLDQPLQSARKTGPQTLSLERFKASGHASQGREVAVGMGQHQRLDLPGA